jgi:hypothetical protein
MLLTKHNYENKLPLNYKKYKYKFTSVAYLQN